jgi:hypothetical protein
MSVDAIQTVSVIVRLSLDEYARIAESDDHADTRLLERMVTVLWPALVAVWKKLAGPCRIVQQRRDAFLGRFI